MNRPEPATEDGLGALVSQIDTIYDVSSVGFAPKAVRHEAQ